jgi:hypothetical protein
MTDNSQIEQLLSDYEEVSISQIIGVELMERMETKFIFNFLLLPGIVTELKTYYKVLSVEKLKLQPYSTVYYDTDDLLTYNQNHNGKSNRFKIRIRSYDAFNTRYIELKFKTNKEETRKRRIEIPELSDTNVIAHQFIESESFLKFSELHETLTNKFTRITMVNKEFTERLTLDIGLSFQHGLQHVEFPSIVVAEIKKDSITRSSVFPAIIKKYGVRPISFSKYCVGMILLNPGLKYNNYKSKILQLQKQCI